MELNRGAVFLSEEDYNENWNYARLVIKKGFKNMYYFVSEQGERVNGHFEVEVKDEISEKELNDFMKIFDISGKYHNITQIKEMVVLNGFDFKKYMAYENIYKMSEDKVDHEQMILDANRLVLNYATSIKTYIDMETRILNKEKGKEEQKDFHETCAHFYDTSKEYRFWVNLRNYAVHCELPYCGYRESEAGERAIFCTKEHLLEFDNWKHSKKDILEMEDEIDLPAMVDEMGGIIYALYIDFFRYFGDEIIDAMERFSKFCEKYDVKHPIIMKLPKKGSFEGASLMPLPIEHLFDSFDVLKNHPKVNITIVNEK